MIKKFLYKAAGFTVLAGMNIFTSPAQAEDFSPPPWRGAPLTTVQEWDFNTSLPELFPDGDLGWSHECGDKIFTGNGDPFANFENPKAVTFGIPNCIDEQPMKLMHVQVTIGDGEDVDINNIAARDDSGSPVINTIPRKRQINPFDMFDDDTYDFYLFEWKHFPNPDFEVFDIVLEGNTNVYQVVVDTYSVPEPITILGSATALGFGAFFKRKLKTSK